MSTDFGARVETLLADTDVATELQGIVAREPQTLATQIRLTETPSPTFHESERAALFAALLADAGVHDIRTDDLGDVIGRLGPVEDEAALLLTAHLDTVFDADTDTRVRIDDDGIYHGAGIVDDDRGLAAVLSVATALARVEPRLAHGLLIGANVREEGKGNLGGIAHLLVSDSPAFQRCITVDGADPARVVTVGPACKSYIIRFTGPGGHAYGDHGRPSAVHAAARATVAIADYPLPKDPKTIANVGAVHGGVTETSIAYEASIEVDLRSDEQATLETLAEHIHAAVLTAVETENSRTDTTAGEISCSFEQTCEIPGGRLPVDDDLAAAAIAALRALGLDARSGAAATTDANVPLSQGMSALCLGGGGAGANEHSTAELFDPAQSHLGPQGVFLTTLAVVGLE